MNDAVRERQPVVTKIFSPLITHSFVASSSTAVV